MKVCTNDGGAGPLPGDTKAKSYVAKPVRSSYQKRAEDGGTTHRQLPREAPWRGQVKSGGVQKDQTGNALKVAGTVNKANHPTPIVQDESDITVDMQVIQKGREIGDATGERVVIMGVVRFVRQSHSNVIGYDDAVGVSKLIN